MSGNWLQLRDSYGKLVKYVKTNLLNRNGQIDLLLEEIKCQQNGNAIAMPAKVH